MRGSHQILGSYTAEVAKYKVTSDCNLLVIPPSLRLFTVSIMLADLFSLDRQKNKEKYVLRQTKTVNDEVRLSWTSLADLELISQKSKDVNLLDLSRSLADINLDP